MNRKSLFLSRRVAFIDSSAFLAVLDKRDNFHSKAKKILEGIKDKKFRFFTTNFVVAETHALILSTLDHEIARRWLKSLSCT